MTSPTSAVASAAPARGRPPWPTPSPRSSGAHRRWRPNLEPLADLAHIRVIRCVAPATIAHGRIVRRAQENTHRAAHGDRDLLDAIAAGEHSLGSFVPISLDVPTLTVGTSSGYAPGIQGIAAFVRAYGLPYRTGPPAPDDGPWPAGSPYGSRRGVGGQRS